MRLNALSFFLIILVSCATPKVSDKKKSYHIKQTHQGPNGSIPLLKGKDALVARLVAMKDAKQTLDLQYYIWHDDLTGKLLLKELWDAAKRGVRVRLLLDNLNVAQHQSFFKLLSTHKNIEVRLINPHFQFFNHRMHNKALITDNQVAIIGGRNIGNEYFDVSKEFNFGDFDVLLLGPVVEETSEEFDQYWNSDRSFPVDDVKKERMNERDLRKAISKIEKSAEEIKKSAFAQSLEEFSLKEFINSSGHKVYWGDADLVYDSPAKLKGKSTKGLSSKIYPEISKTKEELILISPYFIPGRHGMKILKQMEKKGVRVIVLTNSLASNDVSSVYGGYKKYRKQLLKDGIEIYEIKSKTPKSKQNGLFHSSGATGLHGKVIISDRNLMIVGSMNLDPRSRNLNTEMGVILENDKLAELTAQNLLTALPNISYRLELEDKDVVWKSIEKGKTKTFDKEPNTTWWMRTKAWFTSLFIPEEML